MVLSGEVAWNYEREAAHDAVRAITGALGVTNDITIKSESHDVIEKKAVEEAIARAWWVDDQDIHVSVHGTTVTLTGTVGSLYQKDKAGRVAWNTPGIYNVKNDLLVEYNYAAVSL